MTDLVNKRRRWHRQPMIYSRIFICVLLNIVWCAMLGQKVMVATEDPSGAIRNTTEDMARIILRWGCQTSSLGSFFSETAFGFRSPVNQYKDGYLYSQIMPRVSVRRWDAVLSAGRGVFASTQRPLSLIEQPVEASINDVMTMAGASSTLVNRIATIRVRALKSKGANPQYSGL